MPWGSTVGCCAHLHIELMQAQCEVLFLRYRCSLSTVTIATWRMPHTPATQCLTLAIHSEQCLHTTEQHTHTHTHTPSRISVTYSSKRWQCEPTDWQWVLFLSKNQNSGSNDHTSFLLTDLANISVPDCSNSCKTVLCVKRISLVRRYLHRSTV